MFLKARLKLKVRESKHIIFLKLISLLNEARLWHAFLVLFEEVQSTPRHDFYFYFFIESLK
jgi:hypothetical protein